MSPKHLVVFGALVATAGGTIPTVAADARDLGSGSVAIDGPARPGPTGRVVVPPSSREAPGDAGRRAHTNYEIEVPGRRIDGPAPR